MVRAVRGMIVEREVVFYVFLFSVVLFQLMTLSATWVVMRTHASATCSAILLIGGFFWYKYCTRIYNRFKFIEPDLDWREDPLEPQVSSNQKKSYRIIPHFEKRNHERKPLFKFAR